MVRPNQIVEFEPQESITFLMFARNEETVKRRVLWLNFPSTIRKTLLGDAEVDDFVENVQLQTGGMVNRYTVELSLEALQ